jgi:hypothetical protein
MTEIDDKDTNVLAIRRGFPVYKQNPSVAGGVSARGKKRRLGDERKGLLIDPDEGEILGRGSAIVYEWEEVDAERFVKLFLHGVKQATGLGKAGLTLFAAVYQEISAKPNSDTIGLSLLLLQETIPGLNERTYHRGMFELLRKQFLFRSPVPGVFFINIRYMFNGDRLAFVKAYRRRPARRGKRQAVTDQLSLIELEGG